MGGSQDLSRNRLAFCYGLSVGAWGSSLVLSLGLSSPGVAPLALSALLAGVLAGTVGARLSFSGQGIGLSKAMLVGCPVAFMSHLLTMCLFGLQEELRHGLSMASVWIAIVGGLKLGLLSFVPVGWLSSIGCAVLAYWMGRKGERRRT